MFVAGIGSSLVSNVPASVWLLGLLLLFKVFAFFYIALWHDFNEADVRQLYPLVLAIGIVVLALVPLEVLEPDRFRSILNLSDISTPRVGLPSVKSLFYRPILFSWFTAFVGLFLVAGYVVPAPLVAAPRRGALRRCHDPVRSATRDQRRGPWHSLPA